MPAFGRDDMGDAIVKGDHRNAKAGAGTNHRDAAIAREGIILAKQQGQIVLRQTRDGVGDGFEIVNQP